MDTPEDPEGVDAERRIVLKLGLAAAAGASAYIVTSRKSEAQVAPSSGVPILPPSPPTTPWMEELQLSQPKPSSLSLDPAPAMTPVAGECQRAPHQRWSDFPPVEMYELHVRQNLHSFHPELPLQTVWGYDGVVPGPLLHYQYGKSVILRVHNDLPGDAPGPGMPEISTHLHNLHTASESDGFPGDWYSDVTSGPTLAGPGKFKDHHYVNCYAGYDAFGGLGDPREALGTMWYHDHRMDFTAPNVYRGLAGFCLIFDELDSGNEHDENPAALRLPSGDYDVPLLFADKQFDTNGNLFFDQFAGEGFIGDKFTVNGKIQPYLRVARRKYRFRLLDGGPSRFYEFVLRYNDAIQPFTYIANDGNLLPAPLTLRKVRLGVAERADIVVDFSKYPLGSELFLTNRLVQTSGRKPDGVVNPGTPLLKFIVDREPPEPDVSRVPALMRPLPPIDMDEVVRTRIFTFKRANGMWVINNRVFDANTARSSVRRGTAEIWELRNPSGGWVHPIHIHFEEGRLLTRNGRTPPAYERGRKDVYVLGKNESVRIFMRFRDFSGKYVMHCHNTVHEDHAMMMRWDIVP